MATQTQEWVVVGKWTDEDGDRVCEVLAEGFASEKAAVDAADEMGGRLGVEWDGVLEVRTAG
jgi:hypothetical protein